jgi:hypothetical protein
VTFFDFGCGLWLESSKEHLPMIVAEVLRLRATSRRLCDRSARRFAQDDGFVEVEKSFGQACTKHEKIEKVTSSERLLKEGDHVEVY